jgi:O-antigen/teichoic acid export membrane protein
VIGNIARTLVILRFQSFLPEFSIKDKQIFEKIFFFGKHSFIGGIATYLTNQIDKILLSSFFPASIVGYYYFAESQSKTVFTYFLSPQSSLILSYSAKYKDNPQYLFNVLKNIGYLIGIFTLPVVVYLSFYSNEVFHIVFGQKWDQSIDIFKCFLIYYFITELTFPFSSLLTAFGLPNIAAKLVSIRFVVLTIALSTTIIMTNNVSYYLYVFIFISFIFSWIKLYIGLNVMGQNSYEYIHFLKNLIPITFIYIGVLFFLDNLLIDSSYKIIFGLVFIIILSIVIHIIFLKKQFRTALSFVLSPSNKFLQRLN